MSGKQALQSVAFAVAVVLFAAAVAGGVDDWPFTSGPMYSQYVTLDTPVFRFRVVKHVGGKVHVDRPRLPRLYPLAGLWTFFYRFFNRFSFHLPRERALPDAPARFEERMTRAFRLMLGRRRLGREDRVELWLDRFVHRRRTHVYRVGAFLGSEGRFVLDSRSRPVEATIP